MPLTLLFVACILLHVLSILSLFLVVLFLSNSFLSSATLCFILLYCLYHLSPSSCISLKNFLKVYFIDFAITVVPFFSPLYSPPPWTTPPTSIVLLSPCPWVVHISYLASPSPILFLTSPCLFCT